MKMFEVGGCVRDEILGVPSKDIDFSVVFEEGHDLDFLAANDDLTPFEVMVHELEHMGFKVFKEDPEFLTVRAQFPRVGDKRSHPVFGEGTVRVPADVARSGMTADFVLARKESDYTDGRRPDVVEPGTLEDDLARRDFTMNAIAKAADGSYIDPFNGRADIDARIIRAVGDPFERLTDDALRAVRAVRFAVTKGFSIDPQLRWAMESAAVIDAIVNNISDERIQVEMSKMFRFDTVASLRELSKFSVLTDAIFSGSVSLDATMKTKGRGRA